MRIGGEGIGGAGQVADGGGVPGQEGPAAEAGAAPTDEGARLAQVMELAARLEADIAAGRVANEALLKAVHAQLSDPETAARIADSQTARTVAEVRGQIEALRKSAEGMLATCEARLEAIRKERAETEALLNQLRIVR